MKKLILKTALITLAVFIAAVAGAYLMTALFAPVTLAEFYGKAGNYSLTVKYCERQYNKTGDFDDLVKLCSVLDEKRDSERVKKYVAEFTADEKFAEYCEKSDADSGKITTREFYNGKLVIAIFLTDGAAQATEAAANAVREFGYTEYNPFYLLIIDCKDGFSESDVKVVSEAINGLSAVADETERAFLERDIELLK